VQCTLQAAPRIGLRHAGVPASGPADPVSMALANRLVGRAPGDACLEITYGPARFRFGAPVQIGIAGASAPVRVGGIPREPHATLKVEAGEEVGIGAATAGARIYLAVAGDLKADEFLGSRSTYLPAGLGGIEGRALRKGDALTFEAAAPVAEVTTPDALRNPPQDSFALRAVPGPDLKDSADFPWAETFTASPRLSRMGVEIMGKLPDRHDAGVMPSAAVFPGTLQATPQGHGFLLLVDGQTTGGYPHLLQVIRADRHLLGQVRPGNRIRFLPRTQARAEEDLRAKQALLETWLPGFRL
ncbi:MAG: biotin-dependent carboxyltransferase family protein, partial [Alphaproteobacteria bacterium]|nr:biotin-dependent carboxyltransferase family protein [Alphaproteobacteria bacterium]